MPPDSIRTPSGALAPFPLIWEALSPHLESPFPSFGKPFPLIWEALSPSLGSPSLNLGSLETAFVLTSPVFWHSFCKRFCVYKSMAQGLQIYGDARCVSLCSTQRTGGRRQKTADTSGGNMRYVPADLGTVAAVTVARLDPLTLNPKT